MVCLRASPFFNPLLNNHCSAATLQMRPVLDRDAGHPIAVEHIKPRALNASTTTLRSGFVSHLLCQRRGLAHDMYQGPPHISGRPGLRHSVIFSVGVCTTVFLNAQERLHLQEANTGRATHVLAKGGSTFLRGNNTDSSMSRLGCLDFSAPSPQPRFAQKCSQDLQGRSAYHGRPREGEAHRRSCSTGKFRRRELFQHLLDVIVTFEQFHSRRGAMVVNGRTSAWRTSRRDLLPAYETAERKYQHVGHLSRLHPIVQSTDYGSGKVFSRDGNFSAFSL